MVVRRTPLLGVLVVASCAHGVDPGGPSSADLTSGGTSSVGATSSGGDFGSGAGNSTSVSTGGSSSSGGASAGGTASSSAGTSSSGGTTTSSGGAAGGTTASGGAAGSGGSPTVPVPPGDLVVQYMPAASMDTGSIHPHFAVVNRGKKTVPLAQLTLRYWYTADGTATGSDYQQTQLDYAEISRLTSGRTTVVLSTAAVKPAETGADTYLQVGFMGPDALGPDQMDVDHMPLVSTKQIEVEVHWPGYNPKYDESNDYSYDGTKTTYADWPKVTLYQNGTLIWGVEPDGTKPANEPPPAGDASTPDAGP
jgi:cellulose 1,4-beta-cellobiosidase